MAKAKVNFSEENMAKQKKFETKFWKGDLVFGAFFLFFQLFTSKLIFQVFGILGQDQFRVSWTLTKNQQKVLEIATNIVAINVLLR